MSQEYSRIYGEMRKLYTESISPIETEEDYVLEEARNQDKLARKRLALKNYDRNRDGHTDDDYLVSRSNAIQNAIASRRMREEFIFEPEEYYDWRSTIGEDLQAAIDDLDSQQITQKPVNNYAKGKNGKKVVEINPTVDFREEVEAMGGELISAKEINEIAEIAAEYFVNNGLTQNDVENLIEEMGAEEFCEQVLDIIDEVVLTEARAAKKRTGGESYEEIKAKIEAREAAKKAKPKATKAVKPTPQPQPQPATTSRRYRKHGKVIQGSRPTLTPDQRSRAKKEAIRKRVSEISGKHSDMTAALKAQSLRTKKPTAKDEIKIITRGIANTFRDVAARERAAKEATKKGGIKAGLRSFFFKPEFHESFGEWLNELIDEGYDLSEYNVCDLQEEYEFLYEKAVSEQQQKIFGLALAVKRGETPRSEVSKDVLDIVDSMSEAEIRKFAKTKHSGIPKKVKVNESLSYDDIVRFMKNR